MKCPKCAYVRLPTDVAPAWQCPACQVAYAKAVAQKPATVTTPAPRRSPAARPTGPDDIDEAAGLAASGQKIVIASIALNFVLRAMDQSRAVSPYLVLALSLGVAVYSLLGVVRICSGLAKGQDRKLLFMVLSFVPFINLVSLVVLNVQATRLLRSAGWRVGLFGARP
jgi:hypothetical protein